ncbi:MAG: mycofactocin system GMC family oxidoreductase MftG [SAR202 cluster bacterium]|jgi:choline dehydrogenase|nr:MAG: mycofactocin system GMC family oxidoreductase MftG [SAR202 cluster bacterium]
MSNIFDTVIVGSGSAGSILANRLSEDTSRNILLIEAGNDYSNLESIPENVYYGHGNLEMPASQELDPHNWAYKGESTKDGPFIRIPRGKVIGGSSSINAQILLRGVREDYDRWAEFGNEHWSFEKVLPYFKKFENDIDYSNEDYHGNSGYIKVKRVPEQEWDDVHRAFYNSCVDYGFPACPDHNKPDSTGVGPLGFNQIDGVRQSTSITYLADIRHRPNLNIKSNTYVKKIIFEGTKAIGLELESNNQKFNIYSDDIIISAGAIESPKLLLNSGVGDPEKFIKHGINPVIDLPGVGKNLRDHPMVYVAWEPTEGYINPKTNYSRVAMGLRYTSNDSNFINDMIVYMNSSTRNNGNPEVPEGIKANLTLNLEESSGEVFLNDDNPDDYPKLFYNYLSTENDINRFIEGIKILEKIGEHNEFQKYVGEMLHPDISIRKDDKLLKKWLHGKMVTGHHSSGTCKMGNDPLAVVDQSGSVIGAQNLKVVDASIMPDCIRANTNATVMLIAERIIDLW